MRRFFVFFSLIILPLNALAAWFFNPILWCGYLIWLPLIGLGVWDMTQKKHTILRNFPILGHFRYLFEAISPEIQQYFIERHTDGTPISRNHRSIVYQRAKSVRDTAPFGTQMDIYSPSYRGLKHTMFPKMELGKPPRIKIGGPWCTKPYEASLLNISAMSFGALSHAAIYALNKGAKTGGFYHNTGEGSISDYHIKGGGDIVWQIGTGYFGCRTEQGRFDAEVFKEKSRLEQVKMIEIKLSQGAKPGHGGVLPGAKNTPEIARIRMVEPWTTVVSPPGHKEFSNYKELLEFVHKLRDLCGGKPVGFKFCMGRREEFEDLVRTMRETGLKPDFISIDGAEGGTGAAPLEFADSVGMPLEPALQCVHHFLTEYELRQDIKVIASGKMLTAMSILKAIAFGADLVNSARAFMLSLGCIQALRCNDNTCPTGVATQDPKLVNGLVAEEKFQRVANFHHNTLEAVMELMAAAGVDHPDDFTPDMFLQGAEWKPAQVV